jgi:hypothetical protein
MPSPRGTNFEKLYILQGRRPSPQMAYDAMRSGAEVGRGSGSNKDAIKTIVRWCCENPIDSEVFELSELLVKSISETELGGKGNPSVLAGMDSASIRKWRAYGENYARKFVAANAKASSSAEQEYRARFPHSRILEASANSTVVTGSPRNRLALMLPQSGNISLGSLMLGGSANGKTNPENHWARYVGPLCIGRCTCGYDRCGEEPRRGGSGFRERPRKVERRVS